MLTLHIYNYSLIFIILIIFPLMQHIIIIIILKMQNLRQQYRQAQQLSKYNYGKLTLQHSQNLLSIANKQYDDMVVLNEYAVFDEVVFYRDKFQQLVNLLDDSFQRGIQNDRIQTQIIEVLKDDPPQYMQEIANNPSPGLNKKEDNKNENARTTFSNFFDGKKQQIERSRLGFKSVLDNIPRAESKSKIKGKNKLSNEKTLSSHSISSPQDDYVKKLKSELDGLRNLVQEKKSQRQFNLGILEVEKCEYQQQIEELQQQIADLEKQNTVLKQQTIFGKTGSNILPIISANITQKNEKKAVWESPYQISYEHNDIARLKKQIERPFLQYSPMSIQIKPPPLPPLVQNHFAMQELHEHLFLKQQRPCAEVVHQQNINISPKSSKLKLNGSQINDKAKNIAIRSKISFLKPSMILYRGKDFDIAVKTSDSVKLQAKKITIFFNNNSKTAITPTLTYKYDNRYYDINLKKKMGEVEGLDQGREELQVRLVSDSDLDSIIEVQMDIGFKSLNFLLPAMFIEFVQRRPSQARTGYVKARVNPIHQASTLALAEEIIPLERIYEGQTGQVYAISKYHEGYVYFRWLHGILEVQTIPQWRLFISYLLLRDY